ncbi:MAG: hypothetical protein ACRD38_11240, partial [Nitrososphaerales archaeon]
AETATEPAAETATEPAAETATEPAAEASPVVIIEADLSTPDVFQTEVTVTPTSPSDGTVVVTESIPENLVEQGVEFQLYQVDGTTVNDVTFDSSTAVQYVDTDGNAIADTIQWEAPLTSETTYLVQGIIVTTAAVHLDYNRNFIENVYDQTSAQDGIWTSPIPDGDYIRVTFEQALTSANDITVYARSAGGSIEVYEKDGTTLVATFNAISNEGTYKTLLTNLSARQDTFDLKIVGDPVEFDLIIDPPGLSTPSVSIEQCQNGGVGQAPEPCVNNKVGNTGFANYGSGNVNGQKAHWQEGQFLPYRAIITGLRDGNFQNSFSIDTAKSSELKHAIDYISSFDYTEPVALNPPGSANFGGNDPCSDIFTCNPAVPTTTIPIPVTADLTSGYPISCANGSFGGSPTTGVLTAWANSPGSVTINSITFPNTPDVSSGATDCPAKFTIDYTITGGSTKVVF